MAVEDLETSTQIAFHGIDYVVTLSVSNQTLEIQVEVDEYNTGTSNNNGSTSSNPPPACWMAQFPATYIEDLTRKTGNFKRFPVFVNMLMSAITHRSDAVFIDLLTTADLELYRKRKMASATPPTSGSTSSARHNLSFDLHNTSGTNGTKRYLILTYAVEFDRVHYPLPLQVVHTPSVEMLQRTIRRLRQSLQNFTSENTQTEEINTLREENRCLKATLRKYCGEDKDVEDGFRGTLDIERELEASMQENKELIHMYQQLRHDSTNEIKQLTQELTQFKLHHPQKMNQVLEHERNEMRQKLKESTVATQDALTQLKLMKKELEATKQKNNELLRQLSMTRVKSPKGEGRIRNRPSIIASDSDEDRSHTRPRRLSRGASTSTINETSRPYRRFDPTAYQQERQQRLQQRASSPAPTAPGAKATAAARARVLARTRREGSTPNGYHSDGGGYSSGGSEHSRTSRRGRSVTAYERQREVTNRLASPRRPPPSTPSSKITSRTSPVPIRGRSPSTRSTPIRKETLQKQPTTRPSRPTIATKLLQDQSMDSFSDIDDRLTALQQFLKEAKQGTK